MCNRNKNITKQSHKEYKNVPDSALDLDLRTRYHRACSYVQKHYDYDYLEHSFNPIMILDRAKALH